MHGNVWEWVEDCYQDNYNGAPTDGSAKSSARCSFRVLRGGSWYNNPQYLRSADRDRSGPGSRSVDLGFRVARTLSAP
jgi:formylglycine-generating enzyme required for sulfatase activity